jgi:hypothetical protein
MFLLDVNLSVSVPAFPSTEAHLVEARPQTCSTMGVNEGAFVLPTGQTDAHAGACFTYATSLLILEEVNCRLN